MFRTDLALAAIVLTTTAGAQAADHAMPATEAVEIAGPVMMVTDLERSLKFYVEGLGLSLGTRLPGNPGPGATVTARAGSPVPFLLLRQQAADIANAPAIQQGNGLSRVMLVVTDSRSAAARLDKLGYTHTPVNDRNVFFVADPDGYRFEIMQRNSRH